jgi:hypothetical protein
MNINLYSSDDVFIERNISSTILIVFSSKRNQVFPVIKIKIVEF